MDEEVGESVGWHAIEKEYQAPVARVRVVGFLVTLADLQMAELVLGDEVVGADAEGGGGQAMVDRIGLGVHQTRIADTGRMHTPDRHVKRADVIK
jgi:hypothetical protein